MTTTLDQLRHQPRRRSELLQRGIVLGGGVLGGIAMRRLLSLLWKRRRGGSPPLTPGARGVSWRQATVWAVTTGAAAGLSQMLARRLAAAAVDTA